MFNTTTTPEINAARELASELHHAENSLFTLAARIHGLEDQARALAQTADELLRRFLDAVASGDIDGDAWVRDYLSDHWDAEALIPEGVADRLIEDAMRNGSISAAEAVEYIGPDELIEELRRQGELPAVERAEELANRARELAENLLTTELDDLPGAVGELIDTLQKLDYELDA